MSEIKVDIENFPILVLDLVNRRLEMGVSIYEIHHEKNVNMGSIRNVEEGKFIKLEIFIEYLDMLNCDLIIRPRETKSENEEK